jgi:hypothetical protein
LTSKINFGVTGDSDNIIRLIGVKLKGGFAAIFYLLAPNRLALGPAGGNLACLLLQGFPKSSYAGSFELLAKVRLRFCELREDKDAAVVPGTIRIEEVLLYPRD